MNENQYISVRETAQILDITEKQVMDLIEKKQLIAYRIANQFLRLKKSEVVGLRTQGQVPQEKETNHPYTSLERVQDFFYYNDFYLVCFLIVLGLLYYIFR
ncbi:MAG TPA: helix-turn-helix domain-containing protein [Candidatus Omnitrophota bacterium]|nr:helix-turn-helix domain-containing protein [Candidatus Omnitrophota bacterium]HQO59111.1 helix-turn-helix domain-containing protein [Candidatus Omnitrophota bacterium]HQP12461.1 helix-turn-helix domain-containing protein [Candidatus Omnitrophota bacterium]